MSKNARARGRSVSGVEVLVKWGDRTLERKFLDGRGSTRFRVGELDGDFYAHPRWLGAPALDVVTLSGGEATLAFNARARLELSDASGAKPTGAVDGQAVLEPGQVAKWALGPLQLEARWAQAPRAVTVPLTDQVDYLTLNALLAVSAATALGIIGAVTQGIEGGDGEPNPQGAPARLTRFVVAVEQKVPTVQKLADAKAEPSSAKAARPEGSSGAVAPQHRPGHSAGGQQSKEDKARDAIAQMFSGKSMSGLAGGKGLGDLLARAVGGMETASACANGACQGMGPRGDGSGGGGLEHDLGSLGLRTRGRAGGDRGYGRGPGLSRPGGRAGVMTLCGKEGEDGECKDVEPGITSRNWLLCGQGDATGCLDKELIRQVIRRNLAGVRGCYERALTTQPSLDGKVAVKFTISLEGTVPVSSVSQSTVGNAELENCVAGRMRLLQFPRSRGVAVVTYPFIFHTAGQ